MVMQLEVEFLQYKTITYVHTCSFQYLMATSGLGLLFQCCMLPVSMSCKYRKTKTTVIIFIFGYNAYHRPMYI